MLLGLWLSSVLCLLLLSLLRPCACQPVFVMQQDMQESENDKAVLVQHAGSQYLWAEPAEQLKSALDCVPSEAYVFQSDELPSDPRLRPCIGNGHIATVIHGGELHMNGLYNGFMNASTRAIIPSMCNVTVTGTTPPAHFARHYSLNVAEGSFTETLRSSYFNITQRFYAHRVITPLIVMEFELVTSGNQDKLPVSIELQHPGWKDYGDVTFTAQSSGIKHVTYMKGQIVAPETPSSGHTPVHVYYDNIPSSLNVSLGKQSGGQNFQSIRWVFLIAAHVDGGISKAAYEEGVRLLPKVGGLYPSHAMAWLDTWERGRVDVHGDLTLAKAIYGSYYAILSSMPLVKDQSWPFIGLSPGGLPWGAHEDDYMGHVFWDQDLWMYPSILMLHANLGRILIGTRTRTMVAATENAKNYGYKGMKFPWESAFSGLETCPAEIYSKNELHVNGDIVFSILQYLWATGDTSIITDQDFGELLLGVGDFWLSKVKYDDASKLYCINDVMPPDEYHHNISNSVFTNVIAQTSLYAAEYAARQLHKPGDKYKVVADQLYIPFDSTKQYHPEFDGYEPGTQVKQADVVLLGFPLMHNMTETVCSNDLSIYERVTDHDGPAMTWSMFCIGWLGLKKLEKASQFFKMSYQPYIANEFQVWTEQTEKRGCANFITGAGGFLQAVIFGYGGLRLHDNQLVLDPELPSDVQVLSLSGLDYLGHSLNISVTSDTIQVMLRPGGQLTVTLELVELGSGKVHSLVPDSAVSVGRGKCALRALKQS